MLLFYVKTVIRDSSNFVLAHHKKDEELWALRVFSGLVLLLVENLSYLACLCYPGYT